MKKLNVFLVSNMFPSAEHPSYGIFVKKFAESLERENFILFYRALIKGKGKNGFQKIVKYILFYVQIIRGSLKNNFEIIYVHYVSHAALILFFVRIFIKKKIGA